MPCIDGGAYETSVIPFTFNIVCVPHASCWFTFSGTSAMPRTTLRRRAGITVLVAAFVSLLLSVTLWFTVSHEQGLFVGLWVPSILSFGSVALQLASDRRE